MTILVFDIETVPDVDNGRKLYNLHNLSDAEVAKAMQALRRVKVGNDFLPHYLQRIVAISVVISNQNTFRVWSLGQTDSTEAELIQRFFDGVEKYTPTLVSWNGSGFDLPVLHYRALIHQVSAKMYWEAGDNMRDFRYNNYLSRYHYRHIDLMDLLSGYQMRAVAPLDDIATMLDFPGKMGMSGSKVWDEWQKGEIEGIRNYCETDVLNTWGVFMRFELMRGTLDKAGYDNAIALLREHLESAPQQHLTEFLANCKF